MATTPWNELRISPSKLGALCAPGFCQLCYWRLLRLKFKKPYMFPMPAILNSLDAQHKQLAAVSLNTKGKLPAYFGAFQDAVEILPIESIPGFHEETNLVLLGKPDLLLRNAAGTVSVVDNKTAKLKSADHPLTAIYRAQVNMYGFLLERSPEAYQVSRVALLYYEFEALSDAAVLKLVGNDYMMARFKPTLVEVEYDPENIVVPLLRKVRELIDMDTPPDGREDCKDCNLLAAFHDFATVTDGVRPSNGYDRADMNRYSRESFLYQYGLPEERQATLDTIMKDAAPDGVLDLWFRDN